MRDFQLYLTTTILQLSFPLEGYCCFWFSTPYFRSQYSLVVSNPSNFGAYYFGVYGFSSTPSYELVANFDATINVTNAQIIHNVIQDVDAYQVCTPHTHTHPSLSLSLSLFVRCSLPCYKLLEN